MTEVFIGRQPIYDRRLEVMAYELLYRSDHVNQANAIDGDHATWSVIMNSFIEIGIDRLVGDHLAFINLTRPFLLGHNPLPFAPGKIVIEILEDIVVDEPLITAVTALSERGHTIALDDFIYHESLQPLVDLADYIKIDVMSLDRKQIQEHYSVLRNSRARLLAEKVETQEDYEFCLDLGFDYFQGYFFCQPKVIRRRRRMPANRVAAMQLVAKLQKPDVDVAELDNIIALDVSLSYRLLRYINSAFFALPKKVDSIRHAIVYLGMQAIKTWASLISLSGIQDKPEELIGVAISRGKMCELLAKEAGIVKWDAFFTVGLFSTLEAMMDASMESILETLPLTDEVAQALLTQEGPMGEALSCTLAYEKGDWDAVSFMDLEESKIKEIYVNAITWADKAKEELVA